MKNRDRLILIDGSSMLVTGFYGNVDKNYYRTGNTDKLLQTSDGRFTNGVFTMARSILSVIKKQKPSHIAVGWDLNRNELHRRERYAEYKTNRSETKPELGSQFKTMQDLLSLMNIPQFIVPRHEADDIIGTLAKKFESEIPVFIMTRDQDALQLITDRTRVWLSTNKAKVLYDDRGLDYRELGIPVGSFEFTEITFKEEFGLEPIQLIDKKAIEGDNSDNIPGVKGVGPASAEPLIKEYGNIETLYEVLENEPGEQLRLFFRDKLGIKRSPIKNLLKNKEMAFISKELATIVTDLKELESVGMGELLLDFDSEGAANGFKDLEFNSLITEL